MLIIGTFIIQSQLQFILNKDLGFNRDNLLYIPVNEKICANFDAIKRAMLGNPNIINVTRTFQIPSFNRFSTDIDWEGRTDGQNNNFNINISVVDPAYLDTMDIALAKGRNFSEELDTDKSKYLVNEEAVKQMGLESPIGTLVMRGPRKGKIIGVVENYHYMPFFHSIKPLMLVYDPVLYRYAMVRLNGRHIPAAIEHIEKIWKKHAPDYPFEFHFIDEDYKRIYGDERRMAQIFRYFTVLAIFISCLGLFALASFMAEQRIKEIGIRKVLGATVFGLTALLSKEFTRWVLISNIVAWPVAYIVMQKWLEGFAYRVDISPLIFLCSGAVAFGVAVLTVSFQAAKAASANPVEALRHE